MVDLKEVGKAGIVIQYEDIVSMIGFNIARFFRSKNVFEKLDRTSIEDVLLGYINRTDEDYSIWLKNEFDININPDDYLNSFLTMQPNLMYSYKVFNSAHQEKVSNLYLYSDKYSTIAEQATKSYGFDGVKYIHGDIIKFLEVHPNFTYLTSSTKHIKECLNITTPIVLVICDDYLYTSDIFTDKIDEALRNKGNIFLRFTGILSGGIIN